MFIPSVHFHICPKGFSIPRYDGMEKSTAEVENSFAANLYVTTHVEFPRDFVIPHGTNGL
jgi:hypothetical protein